MQTGRRLHFNLKYNTTRKIGFRFGTAAGRIEAGEEKLCPGFSIALTAQDFGIIGEIMYGCSEAVIKRDPDETPYFAGG